MVATRFVVDQTDPASLAMLRYIVGFLCLLPAVLLSGQHMRFARRDIAPIALLGIAQFGVLVALLNFGLQFIPSARGALIFATFPLLTMLIAAALGHERLTAWKTAGVLLTIAGVGVALGEKACAKAAPASNGWVPRPSSRAPCAAPSAASSTGPISDLSGAPVGAFAMLASVGFLAILAAGEGFLPRRRASRRAAGSPCCSSASAAASAISCGCGR